jgi:DUF4097 and DUF4098 domain-containing protein YvlB
MNRSINIRILGVLFTAAIALAVFPQARTLAQDWKIIDDNSKCRDNGWGGRDYVCETRELTVKATWETLIIDDQINGGIAVEAWDKDQVQIRATVRAWDKNKNDARATLREIEIRIDGGRISTDGPRLKGDNRGWSVDYELMVPKQSNLTLDTTNGGIAITGVSGEIEARTTNGGIKLSALSGDVSAYTTNGGLSVALHGKSWQGKGLDAGTTNGGVSVSVPKDYSAELEASTVNGGVDFDFPVTVQGRIDKHVHTTLGEGGPLIRVKTTNGGVKFTRG